MSDQPVLVGRSSSPFTRIARIFAAELRVDCGFLPVRDLLSLTAEDYGGNPALKMPTLQAPHGVWFGALNICRALSRQSRLALRIVWPEDLEEPWLANAQELTGQAMATEIGLIMSTVSGTAESAHHAKMRRSLTGSLEWLESHAERLKQALPTDRDLSYVEVNLFCLLTHLEFRDIVPVSPYPALNAFCRDFAAGRASADATAYRFDS